MYYRRVHLLIINMVARLCEKNVPLYAPRERGLKGGECSVRTNGCSLLYPVIQEVEHVALGDARHIPARPSRQHTALRVAGKPFTVLQTQSEQAGGFMPRCVADRLAIPLLGVLGHELCEHVLHEVARRVPLLALLGRRVFARRHSIQGVLRELAGEIQRREAVQSELARLAVVPVPDGPRLRAALRLDDQVETALAGVGYLPALALVWLQPFNGRHT